MKNMTLKKIAEAVNGVFHTEALSDQFSIEAVEANGVFLDSRKVGKGDIFIATRGEHVDGHSFIDSVFDAGLWE